MMVTVRIAKASVAFGRLRENVWDRNGIRLEGGGDAKRAYSVEA